jgi:hypothetical protein
MLRFHKISKNLEQTRVNASKIDLYLYTLFHSLLDLISSNIDQYKNDTQVNGTISLKLHLKVA